MKLNSKLLFWMVVVFGILNILDVITAMFILPGEANPIYLLTKSHIVLWLMKLFFIGLIFWVYFKNEYPSRFWLFSFVYIVVIGSLMVGFGTYSNIMGILDPTIVESASQLTSTQKVTYYGYLVGFLMALPYAISMVSFKLYEKIETKIKYKKKD